MIIVLSCVQKVSISDPATPLIDVVVFLVWAKLTLPHGRLICSINSFIFIPFFLSPLIIYLKGAFMCLFLSFHLQARNIAYQCGILSIPSIKCIAVVNIFSDVIVLFLL